MHRAWSSIVEVPYCFSRSYLKFQGHTALKIVEFDPNWAFPDCNCSLNSPMAMKCCTKLETAKERCPIVFQGHPSNFKVTRYKTSPILTQIGRFRTIGRSQLSNPSDLPCLQNGSLLFWYQCVKPFHNPASSFPGTLLVEHAGAAGRTPADCLAAIRWCDQDLQPAFTKHTSGHYDSAIPQAEYQLAMEGYEQAA